MKYIILLSLFSSFIGHCQLPVSELKISENNKNWFDREIGMEKNEITVGVGEEIKVLSRQSSPFLNNGRWSKGSIYYRGELFQSASLLFDMFNNRLLSKNNSTYFPFKLNKNQIEWFKINGILFERHEIPNLEGKKETLIEVIHKGEKLDLYLHTYKEIRIKNGVNEYFDKKTVWIKQHDKNKYQKINNKRDIKKIFPEDKKELRSFFRSEEILFFKKASKVKLEKLARLSNEL